MPVEILIRPIALPQATSISFPSTVDDDSHCTLAHLQSWIHQKWNIPPIHQWLTTSGGHAIDTDASLRHFLTPSDALDATAHDTIPTCFQMHLRIRGLGGKGGFGANLKRIGNRLARRNAGNVDSCRDLNGRRLRTIAAAKALADAKEKDTDKLREREDRIRKKIEEAEAPPKKKIRFDDPEYFEQQEEIKDQVKDAVRSALRGEVGSSSTTAAETSVKKGRTDSKKASLAMWDEPLSSSESESETEK